MYFSVARGSIDRKEFDQVADSYGAIAVEVTITGGPHGLVVVVFILAAAVVGGGCAVVIQGVCIRAPEHFEVVADAVAVEVAGAVSLAIPKGVHHPVGAWVFVVAKSVAVVVRVWTAVLVRVPIIIFSMLWTQVCRVRDAILVVVQIRTTIGIFKGI